MNIANPIYDVVFKYLMEDSKIAKLLIGSIIGEEIAELEFCPQEHTAESMQHSWTVYKIDFIAKIKVGGDYEKVLIEIQKAKFSTDITRFRKYFGSQYSNAENIYQLKNEDEDEVKKALPIVSIYFLGHPLENITVPVIKVKCDCYDAIDDDKAITEREEFIESLTHDSFVIQVPYLRKKFRNDLECLLSIFDQQNIFFSDPHILNVNDEGFPEKYAQVIRRLQKAAADKEIQENMDAEDYIFEEFAIRERSTTKKLARKDEEIAQKEKFIAQQDDVIAQKENILKEKEKLIKELMEKLNNP